MMTPIIETIVTQMNAQFEEDCLKVVNSYGFNVDKERLKQALTDARKFYDEGYRDGKLDAGLPWISVKDRLPERSGQVVAMTLSFDGERINCIMNMYYSAKHKAFNVLDDDSKARVRQIEIRPAFWMPMPDVLKEK